MHTTTIHVKTDNPDIAIKEILPGDIVIISGDGPVWKYGELVAVSLLKLNNDGVIAIGHGLDMMAEPNESIVVFSSDENFRVRERLQIGCEREE